MTVEELIDQHGDDILRLCLLYMGERQLAEDAFQETFVRAWRHMNTFRGESSAKTWLSHIAVNVCRDMLRTPWLRMRRSARSVEEMEHLPAPDATPRHELMDAIRALPDKYREVIVLVYVQDMKLREAAAQLRLPVPTVSTRLRRARARLAQLLSEEVDA
ncbi:MAG: RNA polymerase sigma factor [Candidatus Ventricola sp.]